MDQFMLVNHIEAKSLVDGPGLRTVLFMQGCPINCTGCQSPHLWSQAGGSIFSVFELATTIGMLATTKNLTISGGEPFSQPKSLAYFLKALDPYNLHVILYSGYTWETITSGINGSALWVKEILDRVDILVDGPYKKELDDPFISYRGSRNQRPIDVQDTLRTGVLTVLDWDSPEIAITTEGILSMPVGLVSDFSDMGHVGNSRMCGQS